VFQAARVLDTQPTYLDDAYRSFCVHPQTASIERATKSSRR
jgi:hypothetical protein